MSSQSGQNYTVAFKTQSVVGTPVTGTGGKYIRTLASQGFSLNRALIQSEELRADGMKGAPRKGVKSAPGSYAVEFSYGSFDELLEHFMQSTFAMGVLTPGSTKSLLTIDQYHADVDLSLQVETARMISLGMTIPAEGMVRMDLGFMGRDMNPLASGSSPSLTSATLTTTEPMAGIDSVITGPGSAKFTSMSWTMNRGGGVQAVIGDTLSPDVYVGNAGGEGTLTGTLETLAWLSEVTADATTALSAVITDGAGNTTEFEFANAMLMDFQAPVGQANAMIVSSKFSFGGTNALTVTNTDA